MIDQTDPTTEPVTTNPPPEVQAETEPNPANREAARYRRQLRDTEAERDQLRELVTTMQRAAAEQAVSDILVVPAGLWVAGVEVADLLDEQGRVDQAKAVAAAKKAMETIGLARRPRAPRPDPSQGCSGPIDSRGGWAGAFAPQ